MNPRHRKIVARRLAQADTLLLVRDLLLAPIVRGQVPRSPGWRALDTLLTVAGVDHANSLAKAAHAALGECEALGQADVTGAYCRLFEGGTLCPVTETAYIRRDKGVILADIAGFYTAFGFQPAELGEKLDHIAVEIEFAAMLLVMLSQARTEGNTEAAQVTAEALEAFARDHLGEWIMPFCDRLARMDALRLFPLCAALLGATWSAVVAAHRLPAPAASLCLEAESDENGPYECGMADTATQLTIERRSVLP